MLDGASPGKGYQAYEPNGSITDGWPLVDLNKHSTGIQLNATDVDADGLLELVCGFRAGPTGRSTIFLLETAAPVTADAAPVGTRQFGAARTGVYGSPF